MRSVIGVTAAAEGRVTGTEENDVAVEDSLRIDGASGDNIGCPLQVVHRKQCEGSRRGSKLGIRSRSEKPAVVEAVDDLAVKGLDADAEFGVAECWIGENKLNFVGELGIEQRRRLSGDAWMNLSCEAGRKHSGSQGERKDSPKGIHAGSLAGRDGLRGTI